MPLPACPPLLQMALTITLPLLWAPKPIHTNHPLGAFQPSVCTHPLLQPLHRLYVVCKHIQPTGGQQLDVVKVALGDGKIGEEVGEESGGRGRGRERGARIFVAREEGGWVSVGG